MIRAKSLLFRPIKIGNTIFSNRFMRSATYEGRSDENGFPKESLFQLIQNLAYGGVGLIVPGFAYPMKKCKVAPNQTGLCSPEHAKAWKSTLDKIHKNTKSKVIFQLCHGGARTSPELSGSIPYVPTSTSPSTHEMTISDINETIESFVEASVNIQRAGADGVQLHCAHGFLLSSFLSPIHNNRHDNYGGSPENRVRLIKEISSEIRKATGTDFFISAKINGDDYDEEGDGGVTPCVCSYYISQLPTVDLFEISAGIGPKPYGTRIKFNSKAIKRTISQPDLAIHLLKRTKNASKGIPYFEGYNVDAAKKIRKLVPEAKLAIVGGLRKFEMMNNLVKFGVADMVSLSRPFIRHPNFVKMLENSEDSKCISCGLCLYGDHSEVKCYFP